MTYATLTVHLELGHSNAGLLQMASDLAERFRAGIIGIAAYQPIRIVSSNGYYVGAVLEQGCGELEQEIKTVEAEFRSAFHTPVSTNGARR